MRFSVNTKQQINPFSLFTYREGTGGYVVAHQTALASVHCFHKSAAEKKNENERKKPNYKRRRQRQRFNFSCRARLIRRSAAQRLSHHSQGKSGEKRELVSLLDAEGPNVPFKVCFVLFLPGRKDFPFRLLVGKVE